MQKCASDYYKSEQHYSNGALAAWPGYDLVRLKHVAEKWEPVLGDMRKNKYLKRFSLI